MKNMSAGRSNLWRSTAENIISPAGHKNNVASNDFNPKIAIFPDTRVFIADCLKKLYLSTQ